MASTPGQNPQGGRGESFFHSVLWSWFGVGVSLFSGLLLAPYTIHKIGDEAYGVWTIILAVIDYFGLMDLGFRSATVKYTAHYRATGETAKLNEVINTAVLYAAIVSALTMVATVLFSRHLADFEHITPRYHHAFVLLILMVGLGWASGGIFNLFTASLEAYQHFDITNRIWIISVAVRSFGMAAVLYLGHGLLGMGCIVLLSLVISYGQTVVALRKVVPDVRLSPFLATYAMFRQMLSYGVHTFLATISLQVLNYSPPILIAHFLPTAFAGYYQMAVRLPQYSVDLVSRVGAISKPHAADLAARNEFDSIAQMGILVNRYCLVLFIPLAMALNLYGTELFTLWIKPEFAAMSGPILPIIATGITLGVAGQFNSSSILYGLAKHHGYAKSLLVEAVLCVFGLYFTTPRFGLMGAALVTMALLVINRGLITAWLLCRSVHFPLLRFLAGIYARPLAIAAPVMLGMIWVKHHLLPAHSWLQLLAACALMGSTYYSLAFWTCVEKKHRELPLEWIRERLGRGRAATSIQA